MASESDFRQELARLEAVRSLGLLDTPSEERFDRYTRLACRAFDVPVALFSLFDQSRHWFKSRQGFTEEVIDRPAGPLDATLVATSPMVVIPDLSAGSDFPDRRLFGSCPELAFYAGCQVRDHRGQVIGCFSIADYQPHHPEPEDVALLADLAELVQQEISVHNLATIDELTALSNRRGFLAIASHALAMCRRQQRPATLLFFDLNGFKQINDVFGHLEGDRVLVEVSRILLRLFRNSDVVARLGGDEFCVLLTGTAADALERPLENLSRMFKEEKSLHPHNVGYSVGAVSFDPRRHMDVVDLVREADGRMYENKRARDSTR